ncbi:energy transducer TonB [Vibrio sp.]|uniref:energy transducer TonB family protein n=1 Tax=Vibrio sp. TaxID=678 RepID=UPI00311EB365
MKFNSADIKPPNDGFGPWLIAGMVISAILHLMAALYIWYQPKNLTLPTHSAIPVNVMLAASIAAPRTEKNALNHGPKQRETIDSVATQTKTPSPQPTKSKTAKDKSVKEQPSPINVRESARSSDIVTKSNKKTAKKNPEAEREISKPENRINDPIASKSNSVSQVERNIPKVQVNKDSPKPQGASGAFSSHIKKVRQNWKQKLVMHLEQHKQYPRRAKRMRKQGMPVIRFTMDRSGKVLGVKLVRSSGTKSLDNEALALVHRSMPLPLPPDEITGDTLSWTLPVRFYVQ